MSTDLLPPPCDLGAPERFNRWNPDQAEALIRAIDSPKRFVGLVLPTGAGKTLVATLVRLLTGKRTAVLTSTKALQDQMMRDFEEVGLVTAMGQSAYECLAVRPGAELHGSVDSPATCDRGPCRAKVFCSLKERGCGYYDALRAAQEAGFGCFNYAYWMTQQTRIRGGAFKMLGKFDVLVLDEAHSAPDELAGFLSTELRYSDVKHLLGLDVPRPDGTTRDQIEAWRDWASPIADALGRQLESGKEDDDSRTGVVPRPDRVSSKEIGRIIRLTALHRVLEAIAGMEPTDWLCHEDVDRMVFDPVWVAGYAERTLFQHTPKVILMSATFRPKTADLLGLDKADCEFYEAQSGFATTQRPVYIVKSAPRVDFRITEDGVRSQITLLNQIVDRRTDRNGVVHSTSYKRRNQVVQISRHRDRMLSHDSQNTRQIIEVFKRSLPGTILVSPSVTTGYDFPYTECEYQILLKVPFPDPRDPLIKARTLEDKDYPAYLAMQALVQSVGRGMRAPDDRCECFILDAHAVWFVKKFKDLAPQWFLDAVRFVDEILPAPLPKLEERRDDDE